MHVDIVCINVDTHIFFFHGSWLFNRNACLVSSQKLIYNDEHRFYYRILSQDIKSSLLMTILRHFFNLRGIRADLFCLWLKFICSCNFSFLVIDIRRVMCSRAVLALRRWQSLRHETAVSRAETRDVRGRGALCLCTPSTSSEWTIWMCVRVNGAMCLIMSQIEDK